jgi:hypothetical protein
LAVVASIHPQLREAREAIGGGRIQQELNAIPIHHFCAVDPHLEHQSLGVYQQMALRMPLSFFPPS